MPFIPKSTGIPTVDKVFKEVFAILNRFQGGEVASSSGEPVYWADIINKPTTFPPESHTQDISTINNLQTALDGKQPVHANLTSISNLSTTPSGRFLVTNGSAIVARPLQNSDLPAIAITDTFVVSSQAAMLALSAAERGDVAVRTDLNKSFILKGDTPASLSDWQELLTPTDAVLSVDGRTGVVSLSDKYQPLDSDLTAIAGLTHSNRHVLISNGTNWTRRALEEADLPSLSISKITNLQTTLDGKIDRLGVSPADFNDIGPNTVRAITVFSSAFNRPNSPSGANYWSGFEFRHQIGEDYRSQIAMGTTGVTPQLAIRNKTNGVWGSWYNVYHEGNFDPANYVTLNTTQTITGAKTFNTNTNFGNTITFTGTNKWIISNTATTDKNNVIILGYPNAANSGYVGVHEINHATRPGDIVLQAGGSNGAIYMSPRAYFGTRPANDHRWTLALDQHNTLYGIPLNGLNIMHNLYHDGSGWRYRYGSGSNSGGVVMTLAYNQFSVQVADNGIADQIATLTPAIFTNLSGNTAFGKSTFVGGYRLEVEGNAFINGNLAMEAASPFLKITPYSNGGIIFNTPSSPVGQHAHWITRSANDGVLVISREVNGERYSMMAFAPGANEILFNSDIYFSQKNLFDVCLSGTVKYNYISVIMFAVGTINTDNCPGIYLDPALPGSNDFTLTGGTIDQRIFVRNGTTRVQYVEGCRIEPGQFRDFLKTGTGWTASGASISGKTTNVSYGTGNISVSNVSTVHINFSPTSTYTLTNGYVGQRVTVVVLSGSAQHWIQGATKAHKIDAGEFRDFVYTTAGWVASAADY